MRLYYAKYSFAAKLTDEEWEALNRRDERDIDIYNVATGYEHPEIKLLQKAGCEELDWDGHFGQAFYFSCEPADLVRARKAVTRFFKVITKVAALRKKLD